MKLPFALASRFVAGESFQQALPAIRTLTDQGLFVTLDLLGEYVSDRLVAERARDTYIDLLKVTNASRNCAMRFSAVDTTIAALAAPWRQLGSTSLPFMISFPPSFRGCRPGTST